MAEHSEAFFYLIDHSGNRRVPVRIAAQDGRAGYAVHPKGKGNDASVAEYTTDEKRMVQAVVLHGRGVRCIARGGPHDGQRNTLGLAGRAIRGYWLAPECHEWVTGAELEPEAARESPARQVAVESAKVSKRSEPKAASPEQHPDAKPNHYRNQAPFRFPDHCCQGGTRILPAGGFALSDLTIVEEGERRLRFAPLGNQPERPFIALVGITPGGQIERFAANLATMGVAAAASNAAFHGAQSVIKQLLGAHGFAAGIGIDLAGDLNDNPHILTTSIVKCCLMVDEGYKFKAPDIAASPAATHCATKRLVDELLSYRSLKWVVVFGEPGWQALHELRRHGRPLIEVLRDAGLRVLQLPHFAQNFQQREVFACAPAEEAALLGRKPGHRKYAAAARQMRREILDALSAIASGQV